MAVIDELKALFERDVRFATWDENVKVDDSDPSNIDVRFYTDTNEYVLTISPPSSKQDTHIDFAVKARKFRAGQTTTRSRHILSLVTDRLDARTWRKLVNSVVGLELVRVQRRELADTPVEPEKEAPASDGNRLRSSRSPRAYAGG